MMQIILELVTSGGAADHSPKAALHHISHSVVSGCFSTLSLNYPILSYPSVPVQGLFTALINQAQPEPPSGLKDRIR